MTNRRNLFESLLDTDNLDTLFSSRDSVFKTAKYVMQCMKNRQTPETLRRIVL